MRSGRIRIPIIIIRVQCGRHHQIFIQLTGLPQVQIFFLDFNDPDFSETGTAAATDSESVLPKFVQDFIENGFLIIISGCDHLNVECESSAFIDDFLVKLSLIFRDSLACQSDVVSFGKSLEPARKYSITIDDSIQNFAVQPDNLTFAEYYLGTFSRFFIFKSKEIFGFLFTETMSENARYCGTRDIRIAVNVFQYGRISQCRLPS